MSRIPKYRAWHKTEKKMYLDVIAYNGMAYEYEGTQFPGVGITGEWMTPIATRPSEIELMQSMEQEDRHGKEIYVSDIIKHPPHWDDGRTVSVIRNIHEFCGDYGTYGDFETEVEVIGNVHEHAYLLREGER